jgi:hypothetical protein
VVIADEDNDKSIEKQLLLEAKIDTEANLTRPLPDSALCHDIIRVGPIFEAILPRLLQPYTLYASAYSTSLSTYQSLVLENPIFAEFVREVYHCFSFFLSFFLTFHLSFYFHYPYYQTATARHQDLRSLLVMPIQRLPRYVLLLTQLVKVFSFPFFFSFSLSITTLLY